jgi:hypothetical protein
MYAYASIIYPAIVGYSLARTALSTMMVLYERSVKLQYLTLKQEQTSFLHHQ